MELDPLRVDSSISEEYSADYWCERDVYPGAEGLQRVWNARLPHEEARD
jgi:hypothetical protein